MATNPIGKDKKSIGTAIAVNIHDLIEERAISIGISKSKYVGLILDKWVEDGSPPISSADRAIKIVEEEQKKYNK